MRITMNKQRNEYGKMHRKEYENGMRNGLLRRSLMRSYQCRQDGKCGVVNTFVTDNLVMETYEKSCTTQR